MAEASLPALSLVVQCRVLSLFREPNGEDSIGCGHHKNVVAHGRSL